MLGRVRSHHPEEPAEEWRREGHGNVRCRKTTGKSDEEEDKERRSRTGRRRAPRAATMEGQRKRGGQTG